MNWWDASFKMSGTVSDCDSLWSSFLAESQFLQFSDEIDAKFLRLRHSY
jgi:hypothetical protein